MAKYDVDMRYTPGKTNVVADALSRVSHMQRPTQDNEVPEINADMITSTLQATPARLEEIPRKQARIDEALHHLKDLIYHGWP